MEAKENIIEFDCELGYEIERTPSGEIVREIKLDGQLN